MEGEDQSKRQVHETVHKWAGIVPFTLLAGLSVGLKGDIGDGLADYRQLRALELNKPLTFARSYQKETGVRRDQVPLQHLLPKAS